MQEAIKPQQIASIRGQIKIGDIIMVQTQKGNHKTSGNGKTGVLREGTVIGIFSNFAHVRLQSGVCESVSWLEMVKCKELLFQMTANLIGLRYRKNS